MSDNSIIAWLGKWENKIGTFAKRSGDRQKLMQQFTPWHKLTKIKEAGTLISIDDRQPPLYTMKTGSELGSIWVLT